jgi:hypothetical protein
MFDLLGNSRRRRALQHLLDEPEITLTDLSARIAAWENDTTITDLSSRQRKQVYSSLYQTHIPRLSDHDVVNYEADDRVVRLTADIAGNWLGTAPAARVTTESLYGLLTVTFMMLSVSFVMAVEGPKLLRFGD